MYEETNSPRPAVFFRACTSTTETMKDNVFVLDGRLAGHKSGEADGNVGWSVQGLLSGPDGLFDEESGNVGMECTVIVIPGRRLKVSGSVKGMRVAYGDVLTRVAAMDDGDAWEDAEDLIGNPLFECAQVSGSDYRQTLYARYMLLKSKSMDGETTDDEEELYRKLREFL